MKLKDVAILSLGIIKSRYQNHVNEGFKYKIIDSPDIVNNGINKNVDKLQEIYFKNAINSEFLLQEKDIIMKMFPPYSIGYVEKQYKGCVVPSNIAIIRSVKIDSFYLYLYLRNNKTKIDSLAEGTSIRILNLSSFKLMEVINDFSEKEIKIKCNITLLLDKQEILLKRKIKLINLQKKYYFKGEKNEK